MISDKVEALRDAFEGTVRGRGDDGYDEARLPWQRRVDPYPALVAEAAGPQDVRTAIRFAREESIPFAVQSTGHGAVEGADDGLLLRTTAMAAVEVETTGDALSRRDIVVKCTYAVHLTTIVRSSYAAARLSR